MKITKKILLIIAVLLVLSLNFCGYHMEGDGDRQKAAEENSTDSLTVEDAAVSPQPFSAALPAEEPVDQDASPNDTAQESIAVPAPAAAPSDALAMPSFGESEEMALPEEPGPQYTAAPSTAEFEGEED